MLIILISAKMVQASTVREEKNTHLHHQTGPLQRICRFWTSVVNEKLLASRCTSSNRIRGRCFRDLENSIVPNILVFLTLVLMLAETDIHHFDAERKLSDVIERPSRLN